MAAGAVLAVAGTALLINARSTYDSGIDAGCGDDASGSGCADKADSVERANTISKLLYVGAGIAGIAGVTMFIVSPGRSSAGEPRVALGARWLF
jgi:hypothetical protein